jgi:hypothetical protein
MLLGSVTLYSLRAQTCKRHPTFIQCLIFGALFLSKSGLIHKHIVEHVSKINPQLQGRDTVQHRAFSQTDPTYISQIQTPSASD